MNHTLVAGASSVCATACNNALLGQVSFCAGCLLLLLSLQWTPLITLDKMAEDLMAVWSGGLQMIPKPFPFSGW